MSTQHTHTYTHTFLLLFFSLLRKAAGFIFVGHPVAIENKKYERNALLFNLGFVFENGVDTKPFESTIRKLAHYLYSMEVRRKKGQKKKNYGWHTYFDLI